MRHRAVVETDAFVGLLEVAANNIRELFGLGIDTRLEGVEASPGAGRCTTCTYAPSGKRVTKDCLPMFNATGLDNPDAEKSGPLFQNRKRAEKHRTARLGTIVPRHVVHPAEGFWTKDGVSRNLGLSLAGYTADLNTLAA